jgi:hypothetical protein
MKRFFMSLLALPGLLLGCSQGTPGGPGVSAPAPSYGQAENTFNLSVPRLATTLQQGEVFEANIGIKRGVNFDQDVALMFTNLPQGVSIEPAEPKILKGKSETKVKFVATEAASVGNFQVKLTGHPAEGGDAQVDFSLNVAAKDSFTFKLPRVVALPQGSEVTFSVELQREAKSNSDVTITFAEFPSGVTIAPDTAVIKADEAATRFQLTATAAAALGRFDIKVTGTSADGIDVEDVLRLDVQGSN